MHAVLAGRWPVWSATTDDRAVGGPTHTSHAPVAERAGRRRSVNSLSRCLSDDPWAAASNDEWTKPTCNSQDARKPDSRRACRTQKRKRPEPVSEEQLECQQLGYVITVDAWRVSTDILYRKAPGPPQSLSCGP